MRLNPARLFPYALLAASVGLTSAAALAPVADRPVAAIFPPWWTAEHSFRAAAQSGGSIVRFGGLRNIVVLTAGGSDGNQRLREAGAWLLVDAAALGGCAQPT